MGACGRLSGFFQFLIGGSASQSQRICCIAIHEQIWKTASTVVLEKDDFDFCYDQCFIDFIVVMAS